MRNILIATLCLGFLSVCSAADSHNSPSNGLTFSANRKSAASDGIQVNTVGHIFHRTSRMSSCDSCGYDSPCGCDSGVCDSGGCGGPAGCNACRRSCLVDRPSVSMPKIRLPKRKRHRHCTSNRELIVDGVPCSSGQCGGGKHSAPKRCVARKPVNLPSSSFRQYFRSNACYTNVWDGYSRECGKNHDCLHGDCDCHSKKQRGCLARGGVTLPPRPSCHGCGGCDAGCDVGCDSACSRCGG